MKSKIILLLLVASCVCMLTACQCNHTWTPANCTTPQTCSLCSATEGTAMGHSWKEASCVTPITCSVCSTIDGAPLGHSWKDATCTDPATCLTCNSTSGEALGHKVSNWTVANAPTCSKKGTEESKCSVCNETIQRELEKTAHTESDWITITKPTKSTKGTRVKNCTVCGEEIVSESFEMSAAEIEAEYKDSCQKISYKELERQPDKYKGKKVKFTGTVVQVCSEAESMFYYSTYRVATSGRYNNVVYIYVDNYGSNTRILEDDKITFYGEYDGLYSYKTVLGAQKTIPSIKVEYID